ncbi:MAG: esterase family protein [Firmicutes bacterium]|nr:esterase family protein [Bacillota bacterium]
MSLIHYKFFSECLGVQTGIYICLPQPPSYREPRSVTPPYPVLTLLHGQLDDYTAWSRYTSIERYADERKLAVVMPDIARSFCVDMSCGYRYFDYITRELPYVTEAVFPLSGKREERAVAGLSMGGYGAFLLALSRPDKFSAAASLSGCLDMADYDPEWFLPGEYDAIFPRELAESRYDLFRLLRGLSGNTAGIPRLYHCCGAEDSLLAQNRKFSGFAASLGVPALYSEEPGDHGWAYWDKKIQDVINWLNI